MTWFERRTRDGFDPNAYKLLKKAIYDFKTDTKF